MQTNRAKWLVFADTPLQVYNACCLAQSRPDVLCDLAIYAQFGQHNEYSRIAASTQLFEHIYQILPYAPTTTLQMRLWKIGVYFGSLNIKVPKKIVSSQYEAFAMACPTPATFEMLTLLRNNNPRIETVLYEDGTGSYTGNCFRRLTYLDDMPHGVEKDKWYVSIIKKCISVMHRNGSSQYRPTKLYVKKPELVSYDPPFDVAALQALSERQNAKFSKDKSVNNNKAEIVLLDVPRGAGDKSTGEKEFDEVANGLLKAEMRIGYRAHPRSSVLPECHFMGNGRGDNGWPVWAGSTSSRDSQHDSSRRNYLHCSIFWCSCNLLK